MATRTTIALALALSCACERRREDRARVPGTPGPWPLSADRRSVGFAIARGWQEFAVVNIYLGWGGHGGTCEIVELHVGVD